MENNKDYLSTFRFYNNKGQRLNAFAKLGDNNDIKITIFHCDRKDTFTKKEGRRRFEEEDYKKCEKYTISFENGLSKKAFLSFMKENYYRIKMIHDVSLEVLVKGDNLDII